MGAILQRLSELSPSRLLGLTWLALGLLFILTWVPVIGNVANAVALVMFVGYPYLIAIGLPPQIVRVAVRRRAIVLFRCLLVLAAVAVILFSVYPGGISYPEDPIGPVGALLLFVFVVTFQVAVFAPFFLATAALNDVRRSQLGGPVQGSVANFIALYFWLFGGVFRIHPKVQAVLHAA